MNEAIGWAGNVFFIIGMLLLARRNKGGFQFNIWGNLMYVVQAVRMSNWSLMVLSIVLMGINVYGDIEWDHADIRRRHQRVS